ncbi:MAG: hypothetical protein ABJC26_08090 [Gemmatimonadaceae bacterium]
MIKQSQTTASRTSTNAAKLLIPILLLGACAKSNSAVKTAAPAARSVSTDPRVGLKAGLNNAGQVTSNMRVLSETTPSEKFVGAVNSDLAFSGNYAIQGSFNGFQVWDISNPAKPVLATAYYCPASQSDVSVYKNLLFISGEAGSGRIDCGGQGITTAISKERLRGIRIFDISDIRNPKYITNVQTCRGSHTHTLLEDPKDHDNVYVYISGSAPVRPNEEMAGCVSETPDKNANSALFRIEVIKVPLAHPEQAAIVSSPRIFNNLTAPAHHGEAAEDVARASAAAAKARATGGYTAMVEGTEIVLPPTFIRPLLDSTVRARNGSGAATGTDSAALRAAIPGIVAKLVGEAPKGSGPQPGPTQCHDITVYPAVGLAGGACEGYGLLLDIRNPTNPVRIAAVSDSNFSYWHSATFNNDGTKVLFSDEWGGGGQPKCRATDRKDWGADAIFALENGKMVFKSYYKMLAPQTAQENCVAHNGSLIPIPGRDVMVQAWYQGGISVFDWTDASKPKEIAYFDRGPVDSTAMQMGGSWSVYWYNGAMISSEIARGLDITELTPSEFISQNEIDAAKTVRYDYLNPQGQPKLAWPPSFALARSFVDQLERSKCLKPDRIAAVRAGLASAEKAAPAARRDGLNTLASQIDTDTRGSCDAPKMQKLSSAVKELVGVVP